MREAVMQTTPAGKVPADDGWFVLNLDEVSWSTVEGGGIWSELEAPGDRRRTIGMGVHVLYPGDTPGFYHRESNQEGFLVLRGECVLVVHGQERRLRPWDFFHCPPGTDHIMIGAGDGPCAIFMVGGRDPDGETIYPVDAVAARHGASVAATTDDSRTAYADRPPIRRAPSPWPLG